VRFRFNSTTNILLLIGLLISAGPAVSENTTTGSPDRSENPFI